MKREASSPISMLDDAELDLLTVEEEDDILLELEDLSRTRVSEEQAEEEVIKVVGEEISGLIEEEEVADLVEEEKITGPAGRTQYRTEHQPVQSQPSSKRQQVVQGS